MKMIFESLPPSSGHELPDEIDKAKDRDYGRPSR
jgi:hypothetical protein